MTFKKELPCPRCGETKIIDKQISKRLINGKAFNWVIRRCQRSTCMHIWSVDGLCDNVLIIAAREKNQLKIEALELLTED